MQNVEIAAPESAYHESQVKRDRLKVFGNCVTLIRFKAPWLQSLRPPLHLPGTSGPFREETAEGTSSYFSPWLLSAP